jgi:hypothetical protein
VTVAAIHQRREQDEALADRVGRAVVRELASWLATGKLTSEDG